MKLLIFLTLSLFTVTSFAGLPPTTSKGSNDAASKTTFFFEFPGFPITHTGVTATLGTLAVGGGGTGSTAFTAGSIPYSNGTILTQDNSNLFWDATGKALNLGSTSTSTGNILGLQTQSGVSTMLMGALAAPSTVGTDAVGRTLKLHAGDGNGVDKQGGSLHLNSGASTGSRKVGSVYINTTGYATTGSGVNGLDQRFESSVAGTYIGNGADQLATNAIDGYFGIPSSLGTPTGAPVIAGNGTVQITGDTTNHTINFYDGSWRLLTTLPGAGSSGQFMVSNGTVNPAWSTATFPLTTTAPCSLVSNTSNSITCLAATTGNRLLKTNGSALSFAQADLTTDVTGTLPLGNGGTGSTAFTSTYIPYSDGTKLTSSSELSYNTSSKLLLLSASINNIMGVSSTNASAGASANNIFIATNDVGASVSIGMTGSGHSFPSAGQVATSGGNKLKLLTQTATPIEYFVNNALASYNPAAGGFVVSSGSNLANSATDGFLYAPATTSAPPVGTPTTRAGSSAITVGDDNKLYFYSGGSWRTPGTGTVTSVALTVPAIFSVAGSPVTSSGTLAVTANGTSGGIPYFNATTTMASSGLLTNHAIVLGGGAGATPTVVGSLGTSTTVLHGAAAGDPTFGAVSLTADVSGVLPVANGGSNKALTLAAGGLVWTDSDSFEVTAAGSAGQHLTSTGTTAPAWTTATFPSTATGTGTFLRADGTNWVASTLTLPNTTTANQILYSSSTSVVGQITTAATSALVTNSSSVPAFTSGSTANRLLRTDGTTISFAQAALTTDVSGTLPIANGGTNSTATATAGGIGYGTGTAHAYTAADTAGRAVVSGGAGAPTFFTPTAGSVIFGGTSGILQQDNASLFFDDTNNRLGIGTATPSNTLSFSGSASNIIQTERHPTADTAGTNLRMVAGGATSGATNKDGGDLVLRGGTSTGTGMSNMQFFTASAGTTGTADNAPTLKMYLHSNGGLLISSTLAVPQAKLVVHGDAVNDTAISSASSTIDFATGNLQYSSTTCGAYTLNNVKDGGAYSLLITSTSVGTCAFTASGFTVKLPPGHGATTSGKITLYQFLAMGTNLIVSWTPGY